MSNNQTQPARRSGRILLGEQQLGRQQSEESVAFARRREKRRKANKLAKAARKKNR